MPAFIDTQTQKEFFFCHNAKAGGSSFRDCLLKNGFERSPLAVTGGSQAQPWAHVDSSMADLVWPSEMPSIALVRHPYARILSHYNYIVAHAFCGAVKYHDKTSPWATINSWVEYMLGVNGMVHKLPVKGNSMAQGWSANFGHLRPQTSLLYHETEIYKLEDGLEPLHKWVEGYVGRPLKHTNLWVNKNKKFFEVDDMTNDTNQLIFESYRQDFKLLNYNP